MHGGERREREHHAVDRPALLHHPAVEHDQARTLIRPTRVAAVTAMSCRLGSARWVRENGRTDQTKLLSSVDRPHTAADARPSCGTKKKKRPGLRKSAGLIALRSTAIGQARRTMTEASATSTELSAGADDVGVVDADAQPVEHSCGAGVSIESAISALPCSRLRETVMFAMFTPAFAEHRADRPITPGTSS